MNTHFKFLCDLRQQQNQSWFWNIQWIGLFLEMFIFCCSMLFVCCDERGYGSITLSLLIYFALVVPYHVACAEMETGWNTLLATASVICLLQLTLLGDCMMRNKRDAQQQHQHQRGLAFTVWFHMAAIAAMFAIVNLTISVSSDTVSIVGWLIFIALVVAVNEFVWMNVGGAAQYVDPVERIHAFGTGMTLASILYTLIPCINSGLYAFDVVCPLIALTSAVCARDSLRSGNVLQDLTIQSSGSFTPPPNACYTLVMLLAWVVIITVPPCAFLVSASLQLSSTFLLLEFILSCFVFFFTHVFSVVVMKGPLRWFLSIKKNERIHLGVPVVVVETVAAFYEHEIVCAYKGSIPKRLRTRTEDGHDPNVYYLTDTYVPRVVLVTPNEMVELSLDDPDDFLRLITEALGQVERA